MLKFHNDDCLTILKDMADNYIDLTVTSPPYDSMRQYQGAIDQWSFDKFQLIAKELYRVTKEGGVVVWIVSDETEDYTESGTSFREALYFKECGFKLYDTMIWSKPSPAVPTESRYYDTFEYMFILSKGKPKAINLICDRKNRSTGSTYKKEFRVGREERKYTGGMRTVKEYSRRFNVWDISRGYNSTSHPAVFPLQLARDHVISWSNQGDIVLDPFMGSGTTGVACVEEMRDFIGIEINKTYYDEAVTRIKHTKPSLF